nr:Na+/H+ antiporter subunit E [Ramlibacter cellulosilyticus]
MAHPWLSAVVFASWLLLQGSLAPVHWIWAAVLALVLPWIAHDFIDTPVVPVRAGAAMLRLAACVLWDIVRANLTVARLALDPTREPRPAWLRVDSSLQDPRALGLLATIITMTPGTVSCVIDEERRRIHVHALDAGDPAAVVAEILERYERPLQEIFG